MSQKQILKLQLDEQQLDSFCRKITARSRNSATIHEALNVLEAFVSAFASDSQASDNYRHIQQTLQSYSAKTREKLMQEKTQQLQQGLLKQDIIALADVYITLSRNGFYQVLATAVNQIGPDNIQAIAQWVIHWSEQSRQKAEQASGYPDALDFNKANINIEHYQTMSDIAHFFTNSNQ